MAYIGDMGGQLWRWVMTDPDPDNWLFQKVLVADPFTAAPPMVAEGLANPPKSSSVMSFFQATGTPPVPLDTDLAADRIKCAGVYWAPT